MKFYAIILLLLFHISLKAQNDCVDAIIVCGNDNFSGLNATGIGIQELDDDTDPCGSDENNSLWLKLLIKDGGTLGFILTPESPALVVDFDFWIYGPDVSCDDFGDCVRCSTSNPIQADLEYNTTGMNDTETDNNEGPGPNGNAFVNWIEVQSGETYYLLIDRPVGSSNFSIQWTGTATFHQLPEFHNPDAGIAQCDTDNVNDSKTVFDLTVFEDSFINGQDNVVITYHNNTDDMFTGENAMETPEAFVNTANPQTIYLRMTNTITGCFATNTYAIEVSSIASGEPQDMALCDNNGNGIAEFNLSANDDVIKNGNANSTVTYHLSLADAQNGVNPIGPVYQNEMPYVPQTIWTRLRNSDGCFGEIKSFVLNILPLPAFNNPDNLPLDMAQCDADGVDDLSTIFNLTTHEALLVGAQENMVVTYHDNPDDLPAGDNAIDSPEAYANTSNPQTVYMRMENSDTGCYNTIAFTLEITGIEAGGPQNLELCDINETGIREFNLTVNDAVIKNGLPDTAVTYHISETEALSGLNPVGPMYENTVPYVPQTIWARLSQTNGCLGYDVKPFTINVAPLPVFNNPGNVPLNITRCDGDGVDDQSTVFNLTLHEAMFAGAQENAIFTYHTNADDALAGDNAIAAPTAYANTSNPQTIYVRMFDTVTGCSGSLSFNIVVSSDVTAGEPQDFALCDTNGDGFREFNLALNTDIVANGTADAVVTYHTTEEDAEAGLNPIGPLYQNQLPYTTETIWVRLQQSNCFGHDIKSFTITILDAPLIQNPQNISLNLSQCDSDGIDDNSMAFNLTVHEAMLLGTQQNISVTYHTDIGDAATGNNPIASPEAYANTSSPQTIYIRLVNTETGCYDFTDFEIEIINPLTAGEPPGLMLCDFNGTGQQLFNLSVNDEPIRNGNTNTSVTYYASENDAVNETNPLNSHYMNQIPYSQVIWARLENISGCFGHDIVSFTLTVNQLPDINYFVEIVDFKTQTNAIHIVMANADNFEFSLDGVNFTDTPVFEGLAPGLYTIYIRSVDNCQTISEEVVILNYPKYFTPNGDGINDYWNIDYLYFKPNAIVTIFDRYGKIITGFLGTSSGWDGTYNGENLPSTDYWFTLQLDDGRIIKGHFAMLR